ncbi:MAG: HK97-gp10 family putative phage morphogenesis protein [Planctomycetota bacterium]
MTINNLDQLYELLGQLGEKSVRKAARAGVAAGSTPISREARSRANRESGALKRSMGKRTKSYRSGVVVATVGPRRGVSFEYQGERRTPAHYAHLVNNGHRNRDGSHTPGSHFMDDAFDATSDEAERVAEAKIIEKLTSEAQRLGQKLR